MIEVMTDAAVEVPKHVLDLRRVKSDLRIANTSAIIEKRAGRRKPDSKEPLYLDEYEMRLSSVRLPRHYGIPLLSEVDPKSIARIPRVTWDKTCAPRFDSAVKLRPKQEPAFERIYRSEEGVLQLGPGVGKTVLALHKLALERKGPALVVVPTSFLLSQWKARIAEHLTFVEGGVGQVGDGKYDWEGRGIVVGIINSLSLRQHTREFYTYFATLTLDEAHLSLAPLYSRVFWRFPGERWGLTATPDRGDALSELMGLHVGPVLYKDLSTDRKARVFFVETGALVPDTGHWTFRPRYITNLCRSVERNTVIGEVFLQAMANKKRKLLALGERKAHLRAIHAWLPEEERGILIAEVKGDARRFAELAKRVVVAIPRITQTGLDDVLLDTILFLTPISKEGNVWQGIGRGLREHKDKEPSMAVFFEDKRNPTGAKIAVEVRKHLDKLQIEWEARESKPASACSPEAIAFGKAASALVGDENW